MFACLHGTGNLTALAFEFSPTVEQTSADTVALDVGGLDRLFGLPQEIAAALAARAAETGLACHIALAANADAAICAARGFARARLGPSVIPQGDEGKFLAPLPLTLLGPTPELLETLHRWGIHRFQELAALPPLGIAERLGPEGLRLHELARGEATRKLLPIAEPLCFEDAVELEYPIELLEPLEFLLARLINGLAMRLATRGLATDELRLRLKLETRGTHERTLRLPVPSLDAKAFLKLLQLDLAAHPPAAPIVHVWFGVNPVKPQAAQGGLYLPTAPEPIGLELTLARIKAIVGEDRAGSPRLVDTHRPGAFRMEQPAPPKAVAASRRVAVGARLSLRLFRPPRPARVALAGGHPSFIAAESIHGKVVDRAGPGRSSGVWWTAESWSRDEWDIALSDGVMYRLYCSAGGWFVEGSYD